MVNELNWAYSQLKFIVTGAQGLGQICESVDRYSVW